MLTSKKGISALQIHRMIGSGSYRTAWFMCHRLRAGLDDPDFRKLMGIVEVDETYIGGKDQQSPLEQETAAVAARPARPRSSARSPAKATSSAR